jgi:hypothetical protein
VFVSQNYFQARPIFTKIALELHKKGLTHKYKPSRGKLSSLFCVEHQGRTKRFITLTLGLVFQLGRGRPNEAETERGDFMPKDPRIDIFHCNSQMGPMSSNISLLESFAGGKHLTYCKIF